MPVLDKPKSQANPRAPQPAAPVRQFSFTDFQVNSPAAPLPGDRLDGEVDRSNQAVSDVIDWAATSLNSDGSLKPFAVGKDQLQPGLFDFVADGAEARAAPLLAATEAASGSAVAAAAEADASALASATQNEHAQGAASRSSTEAQDAAASAAEAAQSALEAAASADSAEDSANHADLAENTCIDYGVLTQAWAEHMPDTIPPNILAVMDVTGDHWSSRWWANRAHDVVIGGGEDALCRLELLYLGAFPAPPTHNSCGQPIVVGTMYYDTTLGLARVWDGSVWHNITGLGEAPADGRLYARNGTIANWQTLPAPLPTTILAPAPPASPRPGDLYWDTLLGQLFVWYPSDPSGSSQWVIANSRASPAGGGGGMSVTVSDLPPTAPLPGDLWWNSLEAQLYIRYAEPAGMSGSVQWVVANSTPIFTPGTGGGMSVLVGNGPPSTGLGIEGDLYLDKVAGAIYGPRLFGTIGTVWPLAVDLLTEADRPATPAAAKYNMGFSFVGGVLGASQLLGLHKVSRAVQIPANFGSYGGHVSEAGGTANATASTVITVSKALAASPNSFSAVGTITFGAGTITPVFATSGGAVVNLAQGDVIRLTGPATADITLANVYVTLVAQEL